MEDATAMIMATNNGVSIIGTGADILTILVGLIKSLKNNDNGISTETIKIACDLGLADEDETINIMADKMEEIRKKMSKMDELSSKIDELFGDE